MKETLTFDDILIVPQFSDIESRKEVDLSSDDFGPSLKLPIISANMDTVTGPTMAAAMQRAGGIGCLHRFCSIEDNVKMFKDSDTNQKEGPNFPMVSIGLGKGELERAEALFHAGAYTFIIDVAHGAQQSVVNQARNLRELLGENCGIIVGNFASSDSVIEFLERSGMIVDGFKVGIGPGCLAGGTRVLMANGTYKNIEDIKLHDRVINKNGKSVEVIGIKFSGLRSTLSYKNNLFHSKTYVTPDHLHWVGDYSTTSDINQHSIVDVLSKPTRNGESKIKWRPISEHGNVTLLMPKNIKFDLPKDFEIDLNDFANSRRNMKGLIEFNKIKPSYDLGYVFGTFLGDGHARATNCNRRGENGKIHRNTIGSTAWYFGKEELHIAEKLVRCIKNCIGTEASIKELKNVCMVLNRNNYVSRLLLEFGKRDKKCLPGKYMCSDSEYVKGLLDGLVDSDGCYHKDGRISFGNTSKELVEQFGIFFYIINGHFPSSEYREPTVGELKGCNIENCKESYVYRSVTRPEFNDLKEFQINRINNVENECFMLPTYDIEVDCDTHSFIANNAIVHNSVCTTRIKTGVGYPQLSAILDIVKVLKIPGIPVIADGGMRTPGDVAKALGAGASLCMIGGMLAGTDETPGPVTEIPQWNEFRKAYDPSKFVKKYRGSASKESYGVQGKDASWRTAEGESIIVPYKGPVNNVLQDIEGGLRSAFSYVGAHNMKEFHKNVEFVRISSSTVIENGSHGKK